MTIVCAGKCSDSPRQDLKVRCGKGNKKGNNRRPPTDVGVSAAAPVPDPFRRRRIALKLALVLRRLKAATTDAEAKQMALAADELFVGRYAQQLARQFPRFNIWLDGIADCGEDAASSAASKVLMTDG